MCGGRLLLKQLVRLEKSWRHFGEVLPVVKFGSDALVIANYLGRDFTIPLRAEGVAPPSVFIRKYPFVVEGFVVLDIGAYLGDTVLFWLHKKASKVIAVEPVPFHFRFLEINTMGLPVECLNVAIGAEVPDVPLCEGSMRYGLEAPYDEVATIKVPVSSLTELVAKYKPDVVKLNCEGCEHYVVDDLSTFPSLGVKKVVVDFHDTSNYGAHETLEKVRKRLGDGKILHERTSRLGSGKSVRIISVLWEF